MATWLPAAASVARTRSMVKLLRSEPGGFRFKVRLRKSEDVRVWAGVEEERPGGWDVERRQRATAGVPRPPLAEEGLPTRESERGDHSHGRHPFCPPRCLPEPSLAALVVRCLCA